jgi:integrase
MAQINRKKEKLIEGPKDAAHRKLAKAKLGELLTLAKKNPPPTAKGQTVASVIDRYLTHAKAHCCPDAYYQRQLYLQLFAEAHGWREVTDEACKPLHLEEWLLSQKQLKSDWTKAHVVKIVQRAFNYAVKNRIITANPFRGFTHRNGVRRRPLTDAEFQSFFRASSVWQTRKRMTKQYPSDRKRRMRPSAGARFRELLIFLRYTGARPIEASRLKWTDIDLATGFIEILEHKTIHSQSEPRPRLIPLHPVILKLLIVIKRRQEPGEFVFVNHRRWPWNRRALSCRIRRARKAAGLPKDAKLYGLRHAFGTRAVLNNVHLKLLSDSWAIPTPVLPSTIFTWRVDHPLPTPCVEQTSAVQVRKPRTTRNVHWTRSRCGREVGPHRDLSDEAF